MLDAAKCPFQHHFVQPSASVYNIPAKWTLGFCLGMSGWPVHCWTGPLDSERIEISLCLTTSAPKVLFLPFGVILKAHSLLPVAAPKFSLNIPSLFKTSWSSVAACFPFHLFKQPDTSESTVNLVTLLCKKQCLRHRVGTPQFILKKYAFLRKHSSREYLPPPAPRPPG